MTMIQKPIIKSLTTTQASRMIALITAVKNLAKEFEKVHSRMVRRLMSQKKFYAEEMLHELNLGCESYNLLSHSTYDLFAVVGNPLNKLRKQARKLIADDAGKKRIASLPTDAAKRSAAAVKANATRKAKKLPT